MNQERLTSSTEISGADWEKTPESVKRLVEQLVVRIEQLEQQYAELKAENQQLQRYLYQIEDCQVVEDHYPEVCLGCGAALTGVDEEPYRVQILEIPAIAPQVSEHRFHALACACCGVATRAWDDDSINGSGYGERVVAHVELLSG